MKKLFLIFAIAIVVVACKKEDGPKPAPSHDPYNHDHPLATGD